MKLLVMQFPPVSRHFISLRSKYSPLFGPNILLSLSTRKVDSYASYSPYHHRLRVFVTIEAFWIDNRIYWIFLQLMTKIYDHSHTQTNVLSHVA
jgi:hypothetical protein